MGDVYIFTKIGYTYNCFNFQSKVTTDLVDNTQRWQAKCVRFEVNKSNMCQIRG